MQHLSLEGEGLNPVNDSNMFVVSTELEPGENYKRNNLKLLLDVMYAVNLLLGMKSQAQHLKLIKLLTFISIYS
jgi:hypothetical protein